VHDASWLLNLADSVPYHKGVMRAAAFVLACLACICHGHRAQHVEQDRIQQVVYVRQPHSLRRVLAPNTLKSLASVLLSFISPNFGGHGHHMPVRELNNNRLRAQQAILEVSGEDANSEDPSSISRRDALRRAALAAGSATLLASADAAKAAKNSPAAVISGLPDMTKEKKLVRTQQLEAKWTATDGFKREEIITFNEDAYKAMRDDASRTPAFEKAIQNRLSKSPPETQTMLDIGTGPFALFALAAARAGVKKVYAVESRPEAARRARKVIEAAKDIKPGVIEVIDGITTDVKLPEKVDFLVAEIAGSVGSEEGCCATIKDAQNRFLKRPDDPNSYIPFKVQTFGAPATYAPHYALGPDQGFDWDKLDGEPVRLNCRDQSLQLLADPLLIEDICFADPALVNTGKLPSVTDLKWTFDNERVVANAKVYEKELVEERVDRIEARREGRKVAETFSGIAMWPKLILDPEGTIVIESRGPKGEFQKSHWQTVLPIFATRPVNIQSGQTLQATFEVDFLEGKVSPPPKYYMTGEILKPA